MSAQVIGYIGENGTRDIRIPIGDLLEKWPDLHPSLVMRPVGGTNDEAYPVDYELDGSDLVWHVSSADTAVAGTTQAAIRLAASDGRVALDEPFEVIVSPNLSPNGNPPDAIKPWVDTLAALVPQVEAAIPAANAAAERAENAAQNWESGTAADADKLNGKPPEHYLPAVNLLDNSDWRVKENIINQRGGTLYTGDGNKPVYGIDRWYTWGVGATLTVNSESITIAGSPFLQNVPLNRFTAGKTYTYVCKMKDGTLRIANAQYGSNAGGATYKIYLEWVGGSGIGYRAYIYPGELEWAALYEGTYTADTLLPFVPKSRIEELYNCGLVHNGDYPGVNLKSVFATAADLHAAVAAGDFSKIHVGDYWPITLNGTIYDYASGEEKTLNNAIINMEVAGVNFYRNYGDTAVPNNLLFCSRDLLPWTLMFRSEDTTWYDADATIPWLGSHLYQTLNNPSNGLLPLVATTDIGAYIYTGPNGKGMRFLGEKKGSTATTATEWTWADRGKLFLPAEREVWGTDTKSEHSYGGGLALQWPIFAGTMRHIVKGLGNGGVRSPWWCCSSHAGSSSYVCFVYYDGRPDSHSASNAFIGVPVCFVFT